MAHKATTRKIIFFTRLSLFVGMCLIFYIDLNYQSNQIGKLILQRVQKGYGFRFLSTAAVLSIITYSTRFLRLV